eukprot:s675_g4.t1
MAFTMVLGLVMLLPLVITWFNWFNSGATVSEDANVEIQQEPMVNELSSASCSDAAGSSDAMPRSSTAVRIGSVPVATSGASSSTAPVWGGVDETGMPRFNSEIQLPIPNDTWTPEAMLTWMYERRMRRRTGATTEGRRGLYDERFALLREVMGAYRTGDAATREAAAQMTREMHDFSEDETSPTPGLSSSEMTSVMHDTQRAYEIGNQVAGLASGNNAAGSSGSAHVDALANQLIRMLSGENVVENPEEEEPTSSDVEWKPRVSDADAI